MTESLIGITILLVLVFLRVPIGFAMALVGGVGFALMRSVDAAGAMIGSTVFDTGLSYTLSVVPLFIFMGNVLAQSGIAHGLFAGADRLFGRMRGGLALATVLSCGGFSAVSGSSLATAATMSRVALPPMRKFGYDDRLAAGAIAAGGTLGILIPPSVILIIYGLLTETDIGDLFIAGLLPGALGILLYLLAVIVTVRLDPSKAPEVGEAVPMTRRDTIGVLGTLALFVFIMGGIYGGVFTPIEAGGMGALFALVLALAIRGLDWAGFRSAVRETVLATAMIFAIIIGAEIFSTFINFAGLPAEMVDLIYEMDLSPWLVIGVMVLIYLVMGCVFESLSMILLTVPVFYPVVQQLDFGGGMLSNPDDVLIWFAIVVVVVTEISLITPPVGMNVFVMRSVIPDIELMTVFRGVFPFWIADLVRLALLIAVPWFSLALL
ncbi:TRAP transporter, DctM subunit [Palleronia marisminoris]|uniref:TRAP transporter large permease protein n=1 Tax=Palleronia marisminoris TaxID=315423 RepID=A0A1Y5S7M7_9RHOB|nr:TRAP transporter large permease [Palleronia marisminoris]SFG67256.1 TRAP transporter, DctM subunit [Palleronia marisminoris]SLN34313.1 Sialic acid TRAP transporter permease protein SiaT [Palleronia marisminoris]